MTRRIVQILATFITNAYWLFPFGAFGIYTGKLKSVCVPGLNCWSCPAAVGGCPIGAIQNFLASIRLTLASGQYRFGFYVIGFLGIIGSLVGRMPCGWLCPFGFFQDLMHKIPSPKFGIWKPLTWLKYVVLALFVIILPLVVVDDFGFGSTWFCKYICPAGTLEAGIPLLFLRPDLRELVGGLFFNKLTILILLLIWMVMTSRPFCRTLCPLGAIYSLFNKVSLFTMRWDKEACTHCKACETVCPMGVRFYETPNSLECIRCLKCYQACKFDAISFEIKGLEQPRLVPRRSKGQPNHS